MKTHPLKEYSSKAMKEFVARGLPVSFKAQSTTNGYEMTIYDVIGSEDTNAGTFAEALVEADGAPLTIRLSSPGGNVFQGMAMYNSLKAYKGDSTVIVDGVCASIATVFALGAKTILTQKASLWMAHNAWLVTVGNAADLRTEADVLDKIDGNLASIYANKTGKDSADWLDMMAKETWFTSAEAIDVGLVDGLADDDSAPEAATKADAQASFDRDDYRQLINDVDSLHSLISELKDEVSKDKYKPAPTEEEIKLEMDKALRVRRAQIATLTAFD